MSELKLNLVDAEQVCHGTIHGSVADYCVAALSAEPETVAELNAALARYIKPRDANGYFNWFNSTPCPAKSSIGESEACADLRAALDAEPWDAGIVVIDLAARIVATESTHSQPGPEGEVCYHDGHALTEVPILYRVPDDWLFVNSVDSYQWSRERRVCERAATPPRDFRPVLFGRPLLQFIASAALSLPVEAPNARTSSAESKVNNDERAQKEIAQEITNIHARWLLTARDELAGQSPRDVLLAHQDFIDFDLHTRALQWSLQDEGPPCLANDSFAYRFAGFGTHEWVLYYDLVRHLLRSAFELKPRSYGRSSNEVEQLIAKLEIIKTNWLESPQTDLSGRIPAILIENERKRLPQAMRPHDMIIDDDCPMCQMFGDETSPLGMGVGFWHLDGANMDEDFAFSHFKTRQEWEIENRRLEDFHLEFAQEQEERRQRIVRGEGLELDRFFDPDGPSFKTTRIAPRPDFDSFSLDPSSAEETPSRDSDDRNLSDNN